MATYYVRISGSDSNNGTSPSTAWRTIGKALGSSGLSSGDTCYIGAGTYREVVTVNMVSATSETKIIGDVTGTYTGDAGEVIWSAYTAGDFAAPSSQPLLNLNARDYLTFDSITFIGGNTNDSVIRTTTTQSVYIVFKNCTMFSGQFNAGGILISIISEFGSSLNWTIEQCRFFQSAVGININATTGTLGGDYNLSVIIRNCYFCGFGSGILVAASGTAVYRGNGVTITNCSFVVSGSALQANNANVSTTFPTTISNCTGIVGSTILRAETSGQIIDGGGNRFHPYTNAGTFNITLHSTSRYAGFPNVFPLEFGQSMVLGTPYRHPLTSYVSSGTYPGGSLGFGNVSGGTSTDILSTPRPSSSSLRYDSGTATSGTTTTLVDTTKNWPTANLIGWKVRLLAGTGSGQIKTIRTNSSNSLTISGGAPAGGNWAITPDSTTQYVIYQGPQVETGKATSGTTTTLVDSNANWGTNQWSGYSCEFDGQLASVASNTATTLTFAATVTAPTSSSLYSLYFPGASLTAALPAAGAFEGGNTGKLDTGTFDTAPTSVRLDGPATQEFKIPVTAKATVIRLRGRYDSYYGAGTKPQALLLAQPDLGVPLTTTTMTAAADTWDTLTLRCTPTKSGLLTLRLVSSSSTPWGRAWFDTYSIE